MLDLVLNNLTTDKNYNEAFFGAILKQAIQLVVEPLNKLKDKNAGISVNLVGAGRIKALNKKYRGKNRVTDVLSFPLNKKEDFSMKLKGDTIELGDIFICLPVAKKDAKEEKISIDNKLAQLTVHGFLHLLGYDHESKDDKGEMIVLQDRILSKLESL
ncbi:MAG: rRNA maturation RNase YbeY [bacterium]|nr:rRNA maturation RNase YbeY [bacterium]